jgi:very-short-patch-repair endonuclease
MTKREREAIVLIERSLPNCRVHAQVAMGALVKAKTGLSKAQHAAVRNRFNQKIVDFVLEDRSTGNVVALVELDDRTHDAAKDSRRDALTLAAGYRTVRIPAGTPLAQPAIDSLIRTALSASTTTEAKRTQTAAGSPQAGS